MRWRIQFNRYAIMGIACDTTDYLLYLLFAYLGTSYIHHLSFLINFHQAASRKKMA